MQKKSRFVIGLFKQRDECVHNFHHITVFVTLQEGANFDQDIYEDCLSELSNKTIPVISSSSETHEEWK